MKPQVLDLDSEVFEAFRQNMGAAIGIVTRQIAEKGLMEGTISAKIKIKVHEHTTKDGEITRLLEVKPDIDMKIGSKGKIEGEEVSGMYLDFDERGLPYVASQQIEMQDLMTEGA